MSCPEFDHHHVDALQCWIDADMQGEMLWMKESVRLARRKLPKSMLQGVKSVISVAMRYTPPEYSLNSALAKRDSGVISAYAHGNDYHDVMKKRLKKLAADLDQMLGTHEQRVFVDTAPVLEHALAEGSGLGWQGKHTLTINRRLGSWFLLGEIFTTAEIAPDAPATNYCGSCRACADGCPTQAIVAPYVVDARRCISYLTIEFGGFIPLEMRPLIGNRIYGCDDCQMVCPWNEHVAAEEERPVDPLKPKGENNLPDLASLLRLDEAMFQTRFRKSPIKRTKRGGLLRNVCVAMGNSGSLKFVPSLLEALCDMEPLIRGHAAWALARLADRSNREHIELALMRCSEAEKDKTVQQELELAIKDVRKRV